MKASHHWVIRLVEFHRFNASVGPVTLFPDVYVLCVMDVVEPAQTVETGTTNHEQARTWSSTYPVASMRL